jgi:branched-chain amino acid transport system substrate-binding protein
MSGYGAVTAWATAVEKAIDILGSYPSQRQIARMLEGHGFFTPAGYHVIREDHQGMSTTFVGELGWESERALPVLTNVSEYAPKNAAPPPGTSATDWISNW